MLIVGAKGFAKEVLTVVIENDFYRIAFYDNINTYEKPMQFSYKIIQNEKLLSAFKSHVL